jgi:hypothetical protein
MLWIFGHSGATAQGIDDPNNGWPSLFSKLINQTVLTL